MIILFDSGRLGNQLFQYAALKELYPNQRLIFFGCGALKQTLAFVDAIVIEISLWPRLLVAGLKWFIPFLAKLRIIGTIQESLDNPDYRIKTTRGIFFELYSLGSAYFQHQNILEIISPNLRINDNITCKASEWLDEKIVISNNINLVFVNVRRGDYLAWPSREYSAVLDRQWYIRAIDTMRAKVTNPIFVFITDDPHYVKDCFCDQPDILISDNDPLVDLALMSLCQHGILSASTFAWWGAWFSCIRSHVSGIYLAPKYWAGHRKKEWVPHGFITNWMTYVE